MASSTDEPGRRGRPPRAEPAEPSGYRLTASRRRHLDLARAFLDVRSHQELIDTAVLDFLAALRANNTRFADASALLDEEIRSMKDNVTQLPSRPRPSTSS